MNRWLRLVSWSGQNIGTVHCTSEASTIVQSAALNLLVPLFGFQDGDFRFEISISCAQFLKKNLTFLIGCQFKYHFFKIKH